METLENNKLIAEFMSVRSFYNIAKGIAYSFHKDDFRNKGFKSKVFLPEQLQYHTSWDWLMPVLEKIEQMASVSIINKGCKIEAIDNEITTGGTSTIEATYQAVVEFIKWYNRQSS